MGVKDGKRILIYIVGVILVYAVIKMLAVTGVFNPYWQRILDQAMIMTIGALGLSIIFGISGQFSIGHAAFFGIGAYSAGLVTKSLGGDIFTFLLALAVGTFMAGLVAFLIGLPVLRLTSDYLGIATLGFGIIMKVGFDNANKVIPEMGGATGMTGIPQVANFEWIFLFCIISIILARNFVQSGHGRACMALREDEVAANVVGINIFRYKVLAFVFGCSLAGLAGALYAHRYPFLHPTNFDFLPSIDFLIIVVLGGMGSLTGTIVTAIAWVFLLEGLRAILGTTFLEWRGVIYALILISVILIRRQGLFGNKEYGFLAPVVRRKEARNVTTES
ncbi:MAG: branched-chain amino acid ABC transporter permease [Eubacteriales bacterium]|nr:branched-chain amino acid ABC transporter permease [Bacillota bacterium]MBV1727328.1 branched-chain amino acid ABC transporter permease [Desulforudis sp.]MDQ7790300.1 branched-chain amino acid ABC transporter permease [Clostridia bacterium]MDZ4041957.1 branched-chain amino acid ABC transporter permease [Eubacteriales bacterium]MBU4533459.1 branched-chain amino acid ABC transporter permease [Bacillota bacterium]